jgi:hypothetical protein
MTAARGTASGRTQPCRERNPHRHTPAPSTLPEPQQSRSVPREAPQALGVSAERIYVAGLPGRAAQHARHGSEPPLGEGPPDARLSG